ncbi:ras-domain-containing protein [Flagelloscypha sp. PMI_526]|nr:ras-domain-containing protein [Flagelloscypha sp. PMI_526]
MPTIKLVVIGASGVGKTSLRGKNPLQNHNSESVTLQIWDTAGQERFSSLSTAFFRGADACILMFDVNKPETLLSLFKLQDYCVVVVGNKTDLAGRDSCERRQCLPPHQPPLATRRAPAISLSPSTRNGRSRSSTRFNSGTIAFNSQWFFHLPYTIHPPCSLTLGTLLGPLLQTSRPASPYSGRSSPSLTRLRTPTLSTSTLATLTPSLPELTQQPDRGPRLFLTSAKTGDWFVRRVEWEERRMAFEDSSPSFVRLGALGRRGLQITSSH